MIESVRRQWEATGREWGLKRGTNKQSRKGRRSINQSITLTNKTVKDLLGVHK